MVFADPEALTPRFAALGLLEAALDRRNGLEEAAQSKSMLALSVRDRAFARALVMATLRHLGPIDRLLQSKMKRTPPKSAELILRLGLAQILYLNVPAFAAVATSVEMSEVQAATRPFKGMINAVLRALVRDGAAARGEPAAPSQPQDYAPPWLYNRWRSAFGEAAADAICARIAEEPATDLSLRDPADADVLAGPLEAVILPGGSLRTCKRGDLALWPGFSEGRWWVQDAAAALPARLLAVRPGEDVLDLCAAPGGKTLQLAASGGRVTALDRSAKRLKRLEDNLARMGLGGEVVTADALRWNDARRFDAVLLDAPCSATGTFRRHPDVLWAVTPSDIAKLTKVQSALLEAAADRVRPGGRLIYCVCSLEPEEGEAQTSAFIAGRRDFASDPVKPGEGGAPEAAITRDGSLRLLPSFTEPPGGVDGFFVARFRKHL